jgi:hypothetical protein
MNYIILTCRIMYLLISSSPELHTDRHITAVAVRTTRRYLKPSVTITLPELILKAPSKRRL